MLQRCKQTHRLVRTPLVRLGAAIAIVSGASCDEPANAPVQIILDVPNGPLDPAGATSVEFVLHRNNGQDLVRTAAVSGNGAFDLGELPKSAVGTPEVRLFGTSGRLVGYGRSAQVAAFNQGGSTVVPVRRPLVYVGSITSTYVDLNQSKDFASRNIVTADLTGLVGLTGGSTLSSTASMVAGSGDTVFAVNQALSPTGESSGAVGVVTIASANNTPSMPATTTITGSVRDASGEDSGTYLAIATSDGVWRYNIQDKTTDRFATGPFDRVVVLPSGQLLALANRTAVKSRCASANAKAQLLTLNGDTVTAKVVGGTGISDVAANSERFFFSDICSGEISAVTDSGTSVIRKTTAAPNNLVADRTQIWFTEEIRSVGQSSVALHLLDTTANDPPKLLWQESNQLTLTSDDFLTLTRTLGTEQVALDHLSLVSGGQLALAAEFQFEEMPKLNLSTIAAQVGRTWLISGEDGTVNQRYESWCKVVEAESPFECRNEMLICQWKCAVTPGTTYPLPANAHRVRSVAGTWHSK